MPGSGLNAAYNAGAATRRSRPGSVYFLHSQPMTLG